MATQQKPPPTTNPATPTPAAAATKKTIQSDKPQNKPPPAPLPPQAKPSPTANMVIVPAKASDGSASTATFKSETTTNSLVRAVAPMPDAPKTISPANSVLPSKFVSNQKLTLDASMIENCPWYHGLLVRQDAESLLTKHGDFLVRKTEYDGKAPAQTEASAYTPITERLVVSVNKDGTVHHVMIKRDTQNKWYVQDEASKCNSVPLLIEHYMKNARPLTLATNAVIINPVLRQAWQLSHDQLKLKSKLGSGAFGEVYKADFIESTGKVVQVAVKVMKKSENLDPEKAAIATFMAEARHMRNIQHDNIVRLIGVCVLKSPVYIVMEYAPNGSLQSYLKNMKDTTRNLVQPVQLLNSCLDAVSGMEVLETNRIVHRDVAARNCLLDENMHVKITDFGLSRNANDTGDGTKERLPTRWLAPECITSNQFTHASDVWAFGVLMWEIFSFCRQNPFPNIATNKAVVTYVRGGGRMAKPDKTPDDVYKVMLDCWKADPKKRPSFKTLRKTIAKMVAKLQEPQNI